MSFADAIGRVGQIQVSLARVNGVDEPAPRAAAAPATAQGGGSIFAAAGGGISAGAGGLSGLGGLPGQAPSTAAFGASLASAMGAVRAAGTAPPPGTPATSNGAPAAAPATAAGGAPATDAVSPPKPKGGATDGADVVATARKYLGVPYVWGGTDPAKGLDCSGLVQLVFRELGVDVPRVARQQATVGQEVPSLSQARPGDLIVTRGGAHIGVYIGDNKMLHAPRPGQDVSIRELFEKDADILTIRRVVPAPGAGSAPAADVAAAQRAAFAGAGA